MMKRLARLGLDDRGAVAPTVALSLIGLIAVAGIAFDYAHMATLDTELQTAADQAALAAASQLDGEDGACERAVAAARTLLTNQTLMANDGGGLAVGIADSGVCTSDTQITDDVNAGVRFFTDKFATDPAEDNQEARFVQVRVATRRANYALTPIVGVFSSGDMTALAIAGMGTSLCKVPPLMICPPSGAAVDWSTMRGVGIKAVAQNGQSWAPGDFGYIGPQDANSTQKGLAFENPVFQCQAIDASAQVSSGAPAPAIIAMNTRFDMYDIAAGVGATLNPCLGASCPPAKNVTKDFVRAAGASKCGVAQSHATQLSNEEWHLLPAAQRFSPRNKSASDTAMTLVNSSGVPSVMGLPRDNCHYTSYNSACAGGRFGDGNWARGDYFNKYHSGRIPPNASTMTRYDTYRWEIDNGYIPSQVASGTDRQEGVPVCNATEPDSTRDRRVVQVAVGSNCGDLRGGSRPVQIGAWVDFFLVQPGSKPPGRGNGDPGNEIYLEVIGPVTPGGNAAQVIRRDVPYLVR